MQTNAPDDVVLIEAHKGNIIVIPPGYGHVTINPTPGQTRLFYFNRNHYHFHPSINLQVRVFLRRFLCPRSKRMPYTKRVCWYLKIQ
ncbi:MAG: hypothetical protein M0Q91_16855 [Methanoregula sp.]|nr:hypothetical protein [Methanoregula sp.]